MRCCCKVEGIIVFDRLVEGEIAGICIGSVPLPWYDGSYEITPHAYDEQVLQTAQKSMRSDVVVHKVPRYDVDNPFGGQTISIAMEV